MKRTITLAAFLFSSVAACAHIPPAAVSCVASQALLSEVVADLGASDYEARLEALAARVGLCVVDATVRSAISPGGAALNPVVVAHGRAWLAAHPATA